MPFFNIKIMEKALQLPVGGFDNNFSYLVTGEGKHSKEAVLIDPTGSKEVIEGALAARKLKAVLVLLTHLHPDHKELAPYFASKGAKVFEPKEAKLGHEELLEAAGLKIKVLHTPGHTPESVCYLIGKSIFTGDTLFARGYGRIGSRCTEQEMIDSLQMLSRLPQKTVVWPGHDYGGASRTLGEALSNSSIMPPEKALDALKKKIKEYEKKGAP